MQKENDWAFWEYKTPEEDGWHLKQVKRGLLYNRYQYTKENTRVPTREDKHVNWLGKTLTILLFPVSVMIVGIPESWTNTRRLIWDRKYGWFESYDIWS